MIYKISNKGKTTVQCQLIGGDAFNVGPGTISDIDSGKIFRREVDRLNRIPGVRVSESVGGSVKPKTIETKQPEKNTGDGKSGKSGGNK